MVRSPGTDVPPSPGPSPSPSPRAAPGVAAPAVGVGGPATAAAPVAGKSMFRKLVRRTMTESKPESSVSVTASTSTTTTTTDSTDGTAPPTGTAAPTAGAAGCATSPAAAATAATDATDAAVGRTAFRSLVRRQITEGKDRGAPRAGPLAGRSEEPPEDTAHGAKAAPAGAQRGAGPPVKLKTQTSSLHKVRSSLKRAASSASKNEAAPSPGRGGGGEGSATSTPGGAAHGGSLAAVASSLLPSDSAVDIRFDDERRFRFEQLVNWNAVVVVYRRAKRWNRGLLRAAGLGPFSHCELYLPSDRETFKIVRGGGMVTCAESASAYEARPKNYAWHMWILTDAEYQRIIDWNMDQMDSQCRYSAKDLAYRLLPSPLHGAVAPDVTGGDASAPRTLFNTQAVILALRHAFNGRDSKAKSSRFLQSMNSRLTTPSELARATVAFFQVPVSVEHVPMSKTDATTMSRHSVTYRPYLKRYPHTDRTLQVA